jgi:hypothetical protein
MIEMLNQIVNAMDVGEGNDTKSGRDCFSYFVYRLQLSYFLMDWPGAPRTRFFDKQATRQYKVFYQHDKQRILNTYNHLYNRYQSDIAHYFRVLYNIFRYIDQSEFADGIYAKILRAQLSNDMLP